MNGNVICFDKGADKNTKKIFNKFNHPKFIKHKCETHKGVAQADMRQLSFPSEWFFQLDSMIKYRQMR